MKHDINEILSRDLPKWPEIQVMGSSVTSKQALEIIRRIDHFFQCPISNDREFEKIFCSMFKIPRESKYNSVDYRKLESWLQKWGYISLEYLDTDLICSSFIDGAKGWINPNGEVSASGYNIGKWPNGEEVYAEWCILAKNFPFLHLKCELYSGEACEGFTHPVMGFYVDKGKVKVYDPEVGIKHRKFKIHYESYFNTETLTPSQLGSDQAISKETLIEWSKLVK